MRKKNSGQSGGIHYSWVIIIIGVFVSLACIGFARFGFTMILPEMKAGLSLTSTQAGILVAVSMTGYLFMSCVCGFLISSVGSKRLISLSLVLIGVSLFCLGISRSFSTAVIFSILTGIGSSGANIPMMSLLSAWFTSGRRGLASGIIMGGSSIGIAAAGIMVPAILGRFAETGWKVAWFVIAGISVVIAVFAYFFLSNHPSEKNLAPVGKQTPGEAAMESGGKNIGSVYASGKVWHLGLIYSMFGFSYIIYTTFFAQYLILEQGFSPGNAGALWSFVGIVSILSGIMWGALSDRMGRKHTLALVFILQAFGYVLFGVSSSIPGFYFSAGLFALTAWSVPAIIAASSGDVAGSRIAPAVLGFITLLFGIGQAVGPYTAGRIADSTGSLTVAFVLAGIVAFSGSLFSITLKMK